jgi:hypothetical protein
MVVYAACSRTAGAHSLDALLARIQQTAVRARRETIAYHRAADRPHEACEVSVDLSKPISLDDWNLLRLARVALADETRLLDDVIDWSRSGRPLAEAERLLITDDAGGVAGRRSRIVDTP